MCFINVRRPSSFSRTSRMRRLFCYLLVRLMKRKTVHARRNPSVQWNIHWLSENILGFKTILSLIDSCPDCRAHIYSRFFSSNLRFYSVENEMISTSGRATCILIYVRTAYVHWFILYVCRHIHRDSRGNIFARTPVYMRVRIFRCILVTRIEI